MWQALNPVKRLGKTLGIFICQSGYQKTVIPIAGSNVSLHGDLCSFLINLMNIISRFLPFTDM
jgi:hypothetical protein